MQHLIECLFVYICILQIKTYPLDTFEADHFLGKSITGKQTVFIQTYINLKWFFLPKFFFMGLPVEWPTTLEMED